MKGNDTDFDSDEDLSSSSAEDEDGHMKVILENKGCKRSQLFVIKRILGGDSEPKQGRLDSTSPVDV